LTPLCPYLQGHNTPEITNAESDTGQKPSHRLSVLGARTHSAIIGRVNRVSVVGNAGSGKSGLAKRIAMTLDIAYVELDAIHHLPGWVPIDPDEFMARISEIASTDCWVIDGNYRTVVVDGPVWRRADTVVWLDLPRRTVMRQLVARTLRRVIRREELWNGNREPLRNLWAWDPYKSIIRWAWTQHEKYQVRFGSAMASPRNAHIAFVRLRSHQEADRWLRNLKPTREL
jgi:adenylate kinase family enzyme